ncbi:hypothetical protein NMG29_20235 [Streptomyces cocklensis]|uniref:DUF1579 domain-containing protein n=1 Tax=Actinacidiphila cocklensis TaxID=887465 RepID=A0A9W4DM19_9ACTN|nr:hypothetical protein [Actinacidiphila cocklensis]MDD1060505.1 hypothetical protein [Actinacidiphila cocklensis]CAG6393905.1 conserved hypothetical protein [Actinacidiphila cocklensis]
MNDFDFLTGVWDVANHRRTDFLDPDSAWEDFPGVSTASRHFGGGANFDEIAFPTKGTSGLTLRLYDRAREEWSLYWSSSATGVLFPPVTGRFTGGTGIFHGEDSYEGKPVTARFVWSGITTDAARWEQSFSVDGGGTWLSNWVMELTRR